MQNKFLYFPSSEVPSERVLASATMKFWQKNDKDYRGLTSATDAPAPNGTIVFFTATAARHLTGNFIWNR